MIVAALLVANRSSGEPQATESPAATETTTTSTPPVDSDTSAVETTTTAVEIADAPPLQTYVQHSSTIRDFAQLPDGRIVSASNDRSIQVWDADDAVPPIRLIGHERSVFALDVLPDGRIVSGGADNTVRIWDVEAEAEPITLTGHTESVFAVAALPDGRVASGGQDGEIRLWDPDNPAVEPEVLSLPTRTWDLDVLADGRIVAANGDGLVRVIDPDALDADPIVYDGHSAQVLTVVELGDGRVASAGNDQTVHVWDPKELEAAPLVFMGHEDRIEQLAPTADGKVVSASFDGTVKIWDFDDPLDPVTFIGHRDDSGDVGQAGQFQTGSPQYNQVRATAHAFAVWGMDDGRIVSGDRNGVIFIWTPERAIADVAQREANEAARAAAEAQAISEGRIVEEINVWVVNNGATDTIQRFTPDYFTSETGIAVNFFEFGQQELREQAFSIGSRVVENPPDVVMISGFEAPPFGGLNGWVQDLRPLAEADPDYDLDDIVPSVRNLNSLNGEFYASPFFAESTILIYNREILDAAGIAIPGDPTWDQIADISEQVDTNDVAGICLSGSGGGGAYGELGASLTTVVNTFGGTWWESNVDGTPAEAQINQADSGFRAAIEFYVDLLRDNGPRNAAELNDQGCRELMRAGEVAMWFGSTTSAEQLTRDGFENLGTTSAPRGPAGLPGGGLSSWGFAIGHVNRTPEPAWEFISWATSQEFIELVGEQDGYENAPGGTRLSTYDNPNYQAANEEFADVAIAELLDADPNDPGTTPRPGLLGVQYVGIPEFQDIGTRCTQEISAAIAGDITVDQALDTCQTIASEVSQ